MVSIVIADDHAVVRAGVRLLLEREPDLRVAAEAANSQEAIEQVRQHLPDVLVLDLSMPGINGLEVARQVAASGGPTRVLILSMHAGDAYVYESFKAGVHGYVLKDAAGGELVRAVRSVASGQQYLSAPLSLERMAAYSALAASTADAYDGLSARERQVLELVAGGRTNAEIADLLAVSPRTVEAHRARLMSKLGLRGQQELLRYAIRRGITSVDPSVRTGTNS